MSLPSHREFHPLLLEPRYWRHRLQEQRSVRHFLLLVPRPDLSSAACEVEEFRFRAHDGVRLWGLIGRCPLFSKAQPAKLRVVGPCDLPSIDGSTIESGHTQMVLQLPAGRRLEDRVLDVLRTCDLARSLDQLRITEVELALNARGELPDECRIADQLRSAGLLV